MHQINIEQIDLNLLLVLKILLEERNVTKAGERLNLSQSATSHALKRLRLVFDDQLLERSPKGMMPTPRAIGISESLQNILLDIEQIVNVPVFIPELAKGTIRIAASDYATAVILPSVLEELSRKSPNVNIECFDWNQNTLEKLKNREIDLGLGVIDVNGIDGIRTQNLFKEYFVSIVRKDHPILQADITIETYLDFPHALITITGLPVNSIVKSPKSHVDRVLEDLGVKRRVMLKLPHFLSAALIISQTDMILTLPSRIAQLLSKVSKVSTFEPPINLEDYSYMQVWAKHSDNIPSHIWLRHLVSTQTKNIADQILGI